jgi:hypothetical protein
MIAGAGTAIGEVADQVSAGAATPQDAVWPELPGRHVGGAGFAKALAGATEDGSMEGGLVHLAIVGRSVR